MNTMAADLVEVQNRKRQQLGLNAKGEARAQEFVCPCGKPVELSTPIRSDRVARLGLTREKHPFHCPACTEAIRKKAEEERVEAERAHAELVAQMRREQTEAIRADLPAVLRGRGVPPAWQHARFERCPDLPKQLVEDAKAWAEQPEGLIFLVGIPGSGKSWLATAMLAHVLYQPLMRPEDAQFVGEGEYLGMLKAEMDGRQEMIGAAEWARTTKFLVFDDLGGSYLTPWGKGEVAALMEYRHGEMLPTVVTSNMILGKLASAVDARVASRISEWKQGIEFPKRDLRTEGSLSIRRSPTAE